jgi:hypothetical protein
MLAQENGRIGWPQLNFGILHVFTHRWEGHHLKLSVVGSHECWVSVHLPLLKGIWTLG